jgi:peptide/nickel transport system substrate-binding protein
MDGTKFEMSSSDTPYVGAMNASQLCAESRKKIGLKPSIVREPQDGYWSNVWNKKPFCSCYRGPRPEDLILSLAYLSD